MKLISPFHDYYDGALAHGADEGVRYVRESSFLRRALPSVPWETPVPPAARPCGLRAASLRMDGSRESHAIHEAFLLVAGRARTVWIEPDVWRDCFSMGTVAPCSLRGAARLRDWVSAVRDERRRWGYKGSFALDVRGDEGAEGLDEERKDSSRRPGLWPNRQRDRSFRVYMDARAAFLKADHTALHLDVDAPILLILAPATFAQPGQALRHGPTSSQAVVVRNPCLSTLGMERELPPYTAFQELSQFIAGIMPGQCSPMVKLADRDLVQKKGFDPKYGFRRRPASA